MIEERWPEYQRAQSDPYAVIGLKAFGRKTESKALRLVSDQD